MEKMLRRPPLRSASYYYKFPWAGDGAKLVEFRIHKAIPVPYKLLLWYTPVTPTLGKRKQEDQKFEVILSYIVILFQDYLGIDKAKPYAYVCSLECYNTSLNFIPCSIL